MVIPIDISEKMHAGNHQKGHTEDFFVTGVTNLLDYQLRWFGRFFDGGKENVGPDLFMQFGLEGGIGSATGVIGAVPQDQRCPIAAETGSWPASETILSNSCPGITCRDWMTILPGSFS